MYLSTGIRGILICEGSSAIPTTVARFKCDITAMISGLIYVINQQNTITIAKEITCRHVQ